MPDKGIFSNLISHDGAKAILRAALREGSTHILLEGPPASGKTVALTAIEEALPHVVYHDAAGLTERDLRDILASDPMILLLDELDAAHNEAYDALPTAMEQGRVTKGTTGERYDKAVSTQVFAACNYAGDLPLHLQSRFRILRFEDYDLDEYLSVCSELLQSVVEWVQDAETARSVAHETYETLNSLNPRDARDVGRMAGSMERVPDIARAIADPQADVHSDPITAEEVIRSRGAERRQAASDRLGRQEPEESHEVWSSKTCPHVPDTRMAHLSGRYLCADCADDLGVDNRTPYPEAIERGTVAGG